MATELTVGLDVGTTAVKAVAVDAEGIVRARARVPHALLVTAAGTFEHDPAGAWGEGPRAALRALGEPGRTARGLGIAAMLPSIVAVDDRLRPLSPAPLYGDHRAMSGARALTPLASREGETLLAWVARGWPDAYAYLPAQAYAMAALGAEPVLDVFAAMAFYPAFDGVRWDPERLARFGADEKRLPPVSAQPGRAVGRIGETVVTAAGADVLAEQLAVDVAEPGDAFVACGTTLVTWAVAAAPHPGAPGLWTLPHHRPDRCLVGGPSNAGGLFLDWAGRHLAAPPEAEPDPGRVPVWLPYVRGERSPLHRPGLRASLHDLDLTHDAGALRRAAYEASGFVVRHHLDLAGCTPRRIVVTGGGARDPAWAQALADCTDAVVERAAVPEGAAHGMAWLARMAADLETSVADARHWYRPGGRVAPRPAWVDACAARYARFRELSRECDPG
ncbi:xylulokinase [Spirillospora sp. NBC_01491]|uniref:xylulokinase n=1 Tax=Spirillospora sp. NBC_01491 TaxID=2976007 RepID=UPI002E380FBE|nr:FGGY-family carbohydrate kinase [Spirillospora sp. NBC_01491]